MDRRDNAGCLWWSSTTVPVTVVERDSWRKDPDSWADCAYEKCEWIKKDELEEDDVRGVRIYLTFDALSTPGASAKERRMPLRRKLWKRRKNSKKQSEKNPQPRRFAYGWYKDANGWWYMERRTETAFQRVEEYKWTWSYLDADGYANDRVVYSRRYLVLCGCPNGTLFVNTVTPDGYHVNGDGAWV